MHKSLQAILLVSCLATAASAGPVTLSVRAGSSIPDLRDNGGNELSSGYTSRLAPFFGVSADLAITPAFSLEADMNYAAQGGQRRGMQPLQDTSQLPVSPAYANFKTVAKLDYIEIPVLAEYHFGLAKRFYVGAGPYAGYLLSAKTVTSGQSEIFLDPAGTQPLPIGVQDFGVTTDDRSDLHLLDWGIQGGAGYQQPLGAGIMSLEVRGGLGLSNIQKDTATDGKNSTGVLVIALGYGMRFGA